LALRFYRQLTLPVWAVLPFAVALAASPPASPFVIAVLAIAAIAFTVAGLVPWWRRSRPRSHPLPH
jgi:hypothetical protein